MKITLAGLLLFASLNLCAQTKEVENYNKDRDLKEIYTVSDQDKNVKEGSFKQTAKFGSQALIEGFYHNNLKDSVWKYYYRQVLVAEGNYKADKKVGVWTGYTRGFERLKYNFSAHELILYIPSSIDSIQKFAAINSVSDKPLDRNPIYINGMQTFANALINNIRYPAIAREGNKTGEVIITFDIDEEGNSSNYAAQTKLGYGLEDEVLRVTKQNDGAWVPALLNGARIPVRCEISVLFAIGYNEPVRTKRNQIVIQAVGVQSGR